MCWGEGGTLGATWKSGTKSEGRMEVECRCKESEMKVE